MNAYLILKNNAGPWELVRHLFPVIPLKSIFPLDASYRGRYCPCYEIAGDKLSEEQLQALAAASMWQSEGDATINFERAALQVKRQFVIAKHWASRVYAEFPEGIVVSSDDCLEQANPKELKTSSMNFCIVCGLNDNATLEVYSHKLEKK